MLRRLLIACSIAVSALSGAVLHAGEVARGELAIVGLGVEVDRAPVSAATGVPSSVQTIFGGRKNDDAPPAPGLSVLGELTGPGIDAPITLSAIPGRQFAIPALHTKGEYTLQNIRLVGASGEFLQQAMPSYAVINVTDALKTEVRVRQLTPEEMRERGILVDARNFDVYEYTFIFSVDQSEIEIPYPVIVDRQRGATIPFGMGAQSPPPLPRNGGRTRIVRGKPQLFDLGNVGDLPPEEEEKIREGKITMPRLPAALVMPTGFGVLHQFFAVILEVSNAADDGSSVKLDSITASLRAPLQMRVSKVMPAVSIGQPVPIKDEKTGATFLVAGARGTAEWTLEALKTGTHTIDIDVRATYQKPGQEDFPLGGKVSTTIVVSDPRFQITFSHPDTVRKDEQYTAYAFVTNLSEQAQHVVLDTSQIPPCSSGGALQNICRATAAGVTDDGKFELDLAPGEMKPVPYKLLSKVTGQIFAGAGSANDETLGVSMQLTMGVSTSGIPLSPATLLMPYYAQFLPTAFVEANLQLLGLGYSLAVAPLNKMTAAHPRVITDDVFTRAQEIARAGQRIFIARQQRDVDVAAEDRDAMTHLSLDLLDNVERVELLPRMPLLAEWDELRRREDAGRRAGAAIARELERTARETPLQFVDDYASATSHRSPFLFAYAHGADVSGNARPYALSVGGRASGTIADVPAEAASGWVRTLPAAEVTKLAIGGEAGELALVGRWSEDYRVVVKPAASSFTLHLLYPDTADGALLRAAIAVSGATPGTPVWVDVTRGVRNLTVQGANGSATASAVPQTPLRVLGAAQDLHLDTGGHIVMMLFNRPVTIADGAKWRDRLALTINVPKAGYSSTRRNNPSDPDAELQIPFANLQDDGRMVGITFDKVLSRNASYEIAVDGVLDRVAGGAPFALGGIVPRIDNDRPGGILTGKVLRPDNTPAAGAFVTLHMPEVYDLVSKHGFESLVQADVTGADGQFMFEHVPRDPARSVYGHYDLAARVGQDTTGVSGAVRLPGEVHTVNLVFFGRGKAQGHLRYDDGTPIARQRVSATSPLWGEKFAATTDANGFYEMSVGVGPLTFYAHAGGGRVAYAANHLRVAGEVITQDLTIARNVAPGVGTVRLIVRRPDTNEPLNNATVIGSSNGRPIGGGRTDANGVYTFLNIPAGVISVALAHSDVYTGIELELLPDQTVEKIAFIDISDTAVEFARIEGVVTRDDPAAPNDRTRDQPVPNAMVLLKEFALVKANADGTYVIENVPVALSGQRITVYDPVTTRHTAFAVPTLVANTVVRLPLRLTSTAPTATGTMRVRVFDAKGEPVSQYQVLSPGFPPFKLRSVAAGVYEAAGLAAPRSDGVVALPLGSDGPYGDQYATGTARVDFDGQVSVTDLRLPGMGTITVRIVVEQSCSTPPCYSQAFGRAALTYLAWDNFEQGFRPKTVEADADPTTGIVTFQKVPARQKVILSTVRHPLGFASADAFLSYDGDAHAITLQLKDMGDVTGRVFAIDNLTPVSGANVRIVVSTASYSQQLTGPDGAFNFPAIAANHSFDVIAELSQDGIYRTGIASGKTPAGGGPVSDVRVIMREQSSIEGRVLDSEGRPVPLAHYWLRELAWPHRSIGTADQPLQADINGRFIISNVFTGPFRISAVSAQNQELRGHYQGTLIEEGDTSQRNVEVRIGAGGVGTVSVTVRDPLLGFEPVANAEVALHRSGHGTFDFTSTDENGVAYFEQVPAGAYKVAAYSKARVRGGSSDWFNVVANQTAAASVELDFRGSVSGYLTDPMSDPANARVAFQPITVQGGSTHDYTMRQTTGSDGTFEIVGLMEGPFKLYGYEIGTERMAFGPKDLFISRLVPEHRNIHLELEKWAKLTVKAYLPNDSGGPGELAPLVEVDVTHADGSYGRAYQGNSLTFEKMSQWRLYNVTVRELVGEGRSVTLKEHRFPPGVFEHEEVVVFGATGPVEVLVLDGGGNPVVDAKVTIAGSNRKFEIFTDPNGMISLPNVPFGAISARTVVGIVSAAASGTVVSRSQPLRLTLRLGSNVEVAGFVDAEAPLGAVSADTRVLLEVTSSILTQSLRLESRTDAQGRFSFVGIPVGNTSLKLTYYGPNELLGAVKHVSIPNGTTGTFTVPRVRVDSTPPRILTIDPPVNSTNVSPAASINVTFSEQLPAKYLTTQYFQLHSTDDGRQVNVQVQTSVRPDGTFLVRLTPPPPPAGQTFPLKSNVLYRFVVSGDIEDLTGHRLHASAGTSFTTVNYIEPAIVLVQPAPSEALGEGQSFRIRFNKAIDINSFNSGNGGIVTLDRLATYKGAVVAAVPVAKFLDPADPTTLVVSPEGVAIAESSFYRLTIAGVRDLNTPPSTMKETRIVEYFSFDRVTPTARIVSPVAEGEKLTSGVLYAATVFVSDDGTNEAGDVAYVDWLSEAGLSIERAKTKPYTFTFVAPATTTGTTFTLKASATDLSFNSSAVASFTWDVAPNDPPRDIVVTNTPTSAYPGKKLDTRVAFKDEGLAVTVALELRGTNIDGTPLTQILGSKKITRTATTVPFADATFSWTLPLAVKHGNATVVATITDASNKNATGEAVVEVLADTAPPQLVSMLPKAESRYKFGSSGTYVIELQVKDAETGVARAAFTINGTQVFASTTGIVDAATGITTFRHNVSVPPRNADTRVTIVATAYDHRDNPVSETREVIYERIDDETLPVAAWITPLDGAALPSNEAGWLTTLRIKATDNVKVTSVRFESSALAAPVTLTAPKSGTTDIYEAKVALTMPNEPFVIRAIVADTEDDRTRDVELPITIDPVAVETTISGDIAISTLVASQYADKSVLIRSGAKVYIAVPLALKNLIVVDGATVSNPEETKLDLTIADRLFIDADSSFNLNEKGYVGGLRNSEGNRVINSTRIGRTTNGTTTGGAALAAGSHAGIGGSSYGSTNATYGSITAPSDFGSGGGALATGTLGGGNGGGAMHIRGDGVARFVIAGSLRADGGSTPANATAGAGGSIDLRARALITGAATRITANGGDEAASDEVDRGGGGGRIAVRVADRYDVTDGVLQARGGRNGSTLEGPQYVDGGAGTIYVVRPDATDGELLVSSRDSRYPASTHRAAGTPLAGTLAFDAITIGPRALARFDAEASGTRSVDPSAFVVTPADLPTVTLVSTAPSAGADVPQATSIVARITAASAAGIREVRTIVDKQPTDVVAYTRFVATVPETASTIAVPATATTGAASLIVRVTDRAGRVAQSAPIAFNVITNVAPVIDAMNVTPPTETYAGRAIAVSAAASDDVEVTSLALTASAGTVTAQAAVKPTTKTMTREFSVAVPPATPSGTDVVLTLTAGDGFPNRAAATRTHNVRILKDSIAPSLAVVQPVANQELQEGTGATFVVEVNTSDAEVAVKDVKVTLDGVVSQLAFVSGTTWRATLAVPNVDGSTPVAKTLTIEARDYEANVTTSTVTVFVKPLIDPNAPLLSWVCASPGAMAPAGYETAIRVSAVPASSTNGVSSVAIAVGGTPLTVTSAGTNLYEGKFVMPIGTPDGTVLEVRVTARSVSNNDASLIGTLTAVAGTEVSTASFIAADDTAFENGTVIVRSGGTLTIAGAHHLRNVVVLPGGTLVQQHADLLRADLLTVDRLYVGCGAAIDVSALGYRKNVSAPGTGSTDFQAGGGHVGRGGVWKRASGSSFGSLTRPREAGAGGWGSLTSGALASAGGGVVRMHATASLTIDGAVRANASSTNGGGGGAGGSVWLTTAGTLIGAGTIDANGGETFATGGGGSGGAIAIEYGSTSGALLNNIRARGAANVRDGGSGSIYLRGAGAIDGELILDNTGRTTSPGLSELPSFGRAIAASVNGNTIAVAGRRWLGPWFEGHRVRVIAPDGTVRGTYRIGTIANDAQATPVNGYAEVKTQDAVAYDGYIVYSPLGINGRNFVAARWANDRWEYDTDSIFTAFNPRSGEGIVASFTKDAVAITALSTFSCEGGCPAAIHGLPVLELAAGEIAANAISGDAAGSPENLGHLDDAEFLVRPDAQGRSILISRGVDTTVTLIADDGSAVNVAPGDALQGLYRFDKLNVVSATVVTNDLLETATAPAIDATSSLATANPTAPLLAGANLSIERGLNGPVLVGPAGAVSDGESAVDVIARNTTRTTPALATPSWNRAWLIFPGTRGGVSLATRPTDTASPFGISSFETITGAGYLSFTPSQTNLVIQAGLAPADTTRALTEPSFYGFRLGSNGRYDIYANAVNANKNAVYTTASVFRLEVTRQRIRWFVDGVRVHEVTANIPASLRLDVSSTAEGAELHSIEYDVTTDGGRARAAAAANGSFRLPLRGVAGDSIRVAARDRHRLPLTSGEVTLTLPSGIGVASVTLNPSEIIGGRSAVGTVTLLAPAGSEGAFIELASSNAAVTVPASIVIPAGASSGTFTVTTTPVLSAIDATITAAYGGNGASAIAQVIKDNVAPTVTITAPAANARYTEGQTAKIAVQATITDADAGMKRAFVSLDGVDYPMTAAGNVYSAQVPVPFVEGTTDVTKTLVVTGEDNSANLGTSSVDLVIAPVVDSAPPSISITCGTDGAFYPPGYAARLRFIARGPSAANPLQSVSVTITDPNGVATTYTPAAVTGVPDAYEFTFTVPDVADGSAFAMRATAMASSGSSAFVDATFRIVKGATEIKTNVTIGAADTTYDNKVVVIYPGAIVTMDGAHTFDRLIVLGTLQPAVAKTLDVTANALFVACDAKLDASALGYAFRTTYPGARNVTRIEEGASHIGRGARVEAGVPLTGATYGSISEPRELGAGGWRSGAGGGAIRIRATNAVVDGAIRANGGASSSEAAGAGGSIWVAATKVTGGGAIEADGGAGCWQGGGGAVSIEYTDAASVLPSLASRGGVQNCSRFLGGAPGTVFVRGPQSTFGSVTIDGAGRTDLGIVDLPSLGSGIAQNGSSGATLITNRATDIPAYFEKHWVRITDANGVVKGTWRIATISAKTVTLAPNGSETISVASGDKWQGVYRFDSLDVRDVELFSGDLIEATAQTLSGKITTTSIRAGTLTARTGAVVTHPAGGSLDVDVSGVLHVESGAAIDVSERGYAVLTTYPGARNVTRIEEGPSHIGRGARIGSGVPLTGATYGSITQPREYGAGGYRSGVGGGVVRIKAGHAIIDGNVRANGGPSGGEASGAGGSVWITTGTLSGSGTVAADGGAGCFQGGGGAVSVEYTSAPGAIPSLAARGGVQNCSRFAGGAPGTVFVRGPQSTFGSVTVDGSGRTDLGIVDLPSLGSGIAQNGSSGATLVTDRVSDVPSYFEQHWVRISSATGTIKGTWRIATISGRSVTLAPNGSETISIAAGDNWQGIYRFDAFTARDVEVVSNDPIEANAQTLNGSVTASRIRGQSLELKSGATLMHPSGGTLDIELSGTLRVESGATIDVSARGYGVLTTYPGARNVQIIQEGASHIGRGGKDTGGPALTGATYGSIYEPREFGAGGYRSGIGGGALRIRANETIVDGIVRANGGPGGGEAAGAGGSIWIDTTRIAGSGSIEADGGHGCWAGGGGAISIRYTDAASTVPANLLSRGGVQNCGPVGGAGSVFVFGPQSTRGNITFDNTGRGTVGISDLPALGRGAAQNGTAGATLVTARATDIPPYFVGHAVELASADGTSKGTWRIASVSGKTMTFDGTGLALVPGDTWRGVYAFDTLKLRNITLRSGDRILYTTLDTVAPAAVINNDAAPRFNAPAQLVLTTNANGSLITAPANAVTDPDLPIKLVATNARTAQTFTANARNDGGFTIVVSGAPDDTFTVVATDSHAEPLSNDPVVVSGAIADNNSVESLSIAPSSVTGGTTATGTVRLAYSAAAPITVALTSSSSAASVPGSIIVPAGAATAQFSIATTNTTANVVITATYRTSATATLAVLQATNALTSLTLDPSRVEGGTSVNATVTLGAPAPAGDAVVSLSSADSTAAAVPPSVTVPAGASTAAFTVATQRVAATSAVAISGTFGSTQSATLTLDACTAIGTAPQIATPPSTVWFDDALPANAAANAAMFDNTQAASGTSAVHFAAATTAREWSFTGASPLTVGPNDELVLYALVNPCNPPRQLAVTWSGIAESANWGENHIALTAFDAIGAIPAGGNWVRLTVLAKTLGVTASTNVTGLSIRLHGGEAWFDLGGTSSCSLTRAAEPQRHASEIVWFDDTAPAGATLTTSSTAPNVPWTFDSSQSASGTTSTYVAARAAHHETALSGAFEPMPVSPGDVLYTYVLVDPCNPPRQILLQFHDGTDWNHRAYWGEDLIAAGTIASRTRMGAIPAASGWVRLEVPASVLTLDKAAVQGVTFSLYDGAAWFDLVGRMPRVNLARGKATRQSSTYSDAQGPASSAAAVDGNTGGDHVGADDVAITNNTAQPFWQVDLGSVQSIDTVQLWNRTDCCATRLANYTVFISDTDIAATTTAAARTTAGVRAFRYAETSGTSATFFIGQRGRFVRVQLEGTNHLQLAEVQVWAPVVTTRNNAAAGIVAVTQSSTSTGGTADRAVNGNVNGDWSSALSVSHTNGDANAWWELDLGTVQPISTLELLNRRDCCSDRLQNVWLFVSDSPIPVGLANALAAPNVARWFRGPAPTVLTFDVNRSGRYVRVQLNGTNALALTEVQIWSRDLILTGLSKAVPRD